MQLLIEHKTKKTVVLAIMGALAIVLSTLENLILPAMPFLPPGAKPGLSNIVTMFVAGTFGIGATFYVIFIKSLFVLVTRGMSAFVISLAGGILSGIVMTVLIRMKFESISYIGISVLAAVSHNIGQLIMSVIYSGTIALVNYLPVLLVFGVISGLITGIIICISMPKIKAAYAAQGLNGGSLL